MKIFNLLQSLDAEEKKAIKKLFYSSNEQITRLFQEIITIDESEFVEKKQFIYRRVFGKKWSEASEKHLRNNFTELFQIIKPLVAQNWLEKEEQLYELNKYVNYLYQLIQRQQIDLFEKEWDYYQQQYKASQYYYGLSKLYLVRYNLLIRNPKQIAEAIETIQQAYRYNAMAYQEDESTIRYTVYTLNYSKEIFGITKTLDEEDFSRIENDVIHTFYNPILTANNLILEKDEDKKWLFVQEIFSTLSNDAISIKISTKFKLTQSIFNYAIMLVYVEELAKAKEIFEFILYNNLIKSAVSNPTVFYFNYSSLLLKLGDIPNALKYHSMVIENMDKIPIARKTLFIIRDIYLNLLNKNYSSIYAQISAITPNLFKEDQSLYVRALLIMYLVDTNDIQAAHRECENARRLPYFENELAQEESTIIEFIYKLLSIQIKENLNKAKFSRVTNSIYQSDLWLNSTHLLKMWLKNYIQKLEGTV